MTADHLKSLIFVTGLKGKHDAEIRTKLLAGLEDDSDQKLSKLVSTAGRLLNLKKDTVMVEQPNKDVNAIKTQTTRNKKLVSGVKLKQNKVPKSPCWNRGAMHYAENCEFKNHKCSQCSRTGHKEGYCNAQRKKPQKGGTQSGKTQTQQRPKSNAVNCVNFAARRKYVEVVIKPITSAAAGRKGKSFKLQVDTASDVTIIGKENWGKLGSPGVKLINSHATSASRNKIRFIAEFTCELQLNGEVKLIKILEAEFDSLNVLGTDAFDTFGVWDKPLSSVCCKIKQSIPAIESAAITDIKRRYADVFSAVPAKCSKAVQLHLKPN
ncbi:uncharacterized protein LOC118732884, partial [Rhagoletis pomonella]|uniref:uncharacterized protein LOC118732884 n=1 Tax=Rhagoletis pomonella TaxID=28610 RepID=UPI00178311A1